MSISVKTETCLNIINRDGPSKNAFRRKTGSFLLIPDTFALFKTSSIQSKTKPCMRWLSLVLVVIFFSCGDKRDAPDVSAIDIDVKVHRFEKDFFAIDTNNVQASLQAVEKNYPAFLGVYFKYFAPISEIAQQQAIPFEQAVVQYVRFIKPLADVAEKKVLINHQY